MQNDCKKEMVVEDEGRGALGETMEVGDGGVGEANCWGWRLAAQVGVVVVMLIRLNMHAYFLSFFLLCVFFSFRQSLVIVQLTWLYSYSYFIQSLPSPPASPPPATPATFTFNHHQYSQHDNIMTTFSATFVTTTTTTLRPSQQCNSNLHRQYYLHDHCSHY